MTHYYRLGLSEQALFLAWINPLNLLSTFRFIYVQIYKKIMNEREALHAAIVKICQAWTALQQGRNFEEIPAEVLRSSLGKRVNFV